MANVYDFDDTIFKGDSSLLFWIFCVKKKPLLLRYLPKQIWGLARYKAKRISLTKCKEEFFCFLKGIENISDMVSLFKFKNKKRIKPWYLAQRQPNDIIITASPEFLVKELLCTGGDLPRVIGSSVDCHTGKIIGENCKGEEKVKRLRRRYPDVIIEKFYSDSYSDQPLANLANEAFIVEGNIIDKWEKKNV